MAVIGVENTRLKKMKNVRVKNGKVELRDERDVLIRKLGNGTNVSAELNSDGSLLLMTTIWGRVELRNDIGSILKTIVFRRARSANFLGNNILITRNNGKSELRKVDGTLVKQPETSAGNSCDPSSPA